MQNAVDSESVLEVYVETVMWLKFILKLVWVSYVNYLKYGK